MLDMGKIVDKMKENLAKNDAWRASARASISARKAMVELCEAMLAITREAREHGIGLSFTDGTPENSDMVAVSRGPRLFTVTRTREGMVEIGRTIGGDPGQSARRRVEVPGDDTLSEWVKNIADEGTDFLSDESQPAVPTKQ